MSNLTSYRAIPVLDQTGNKFHTHPAKFKWLYGGVGGSKSYSLCHHGILMSNWFPGNYGVMGRKVEHILKATLQREMIDLLEKYKMIEKIQKTEGLVTLKNGSKIKFLPMNLPITEYGSINAGWIIMDEASEIKEHIAKYFTSRLRLKYTL